MTSLATSAELVKLARVLSVAPEKLQFLESLPASTVRDLREQVTASLFDRQTKLFRRIAASSRLLPMALLAIIAEKAFGPLLCARVAAFMPPERAIDIAERLPIAFLTEVTIQLDPRRARELVAEFPVPRVVEIAFELLERKDYITIGRFVDMLRKPALKAVLARMDDDEALLRIAFMIESSAKLNEVAGMLPEQRLREIIQAAASSEDDLWPEALSLMTGVDPRLQQRLLSLVSTMGAPVIRSLAASATRNDLWPILLPLAPMVDDESLARLAAQLPQVLEQLDPAREREIRALLVQRQPVRLRKSRGGS